MLRISDVLLHKLIYEVKDHDKKQVFHKSNEKDALGPSLKSLCTYISDCGVTFNI